MAPNVYGFLETYQATRPLLQKSSRALVNCDTIRINAEDDYVNAFVLIPGWEQSDLGNRCVRALGLEKVFITVKVLCEGMLDILEARTKGMHGVKLVGWNGEICPCKRYLSVLR
ncbi:hypothetical protein PG996_007515 [Apiospora saccharicola]|uniref:Uncharacterized protein n=1 Tax=Apiospora saccharicola TaxID=335842 RepID=A0ABR1VEQ0_9PEZI